MKPVTPPINDLAGRPRSLAATEGSGCRYVGIDIGAETLKVVELSRQGQTLTCGRRQLLEHGKRPGPLLLQVLRDWDWDTVAGATASGRLSRQVNLRRVPTKQAQASGYRFLFNRQPATVVSIGSHGFSVLELRANGNEVFRANNRCSQGTGNFLRQLVERFDLSIAEANDLCAGVSKSAPLSARCPVILKTDMTHLANKGEDRAAILAGLFDAVGENVCVLVKPGVSPDPALLIGGVSRSLRVREVFRQFLSKNGMTCLEVPEAQALFFEALGCAVAASVGVGEIPPLQQLLLPGPPLQLRPVPPLSSALPRVRRMAPKSPGPIPSPRDGLVLGLDIGSTGSKALALAPASSEAVWEGYLRTGGNPVGAAQALLQQFLDSPAGQGPILGFGVTGSGREVVGSLLTNCYGAPSVFILNEIAAHAAGARHYDPRVDTIFEIGGQDAKYIRLAGGRVVDCAMNEACSAGTGSFIEEQGRKFAGITDVVQMGREALSASHGVSLGQHCSVFMAEVIEEAVAAGEQPPAIIAGLYDSVIQNYLNRVKGNRTVGDVVFCQGMPFASDALAAAVARQTGSQVVIPPNPGTVGALGIALLASQELTWGDRPVVDPARFLSARLRSKETFICQSTVGCGGAGNRCRIDSLKTMVAGQPQRFHWGGGCALYDKGTRKKKLPDLAPDPFRERDTLIQKLRQSAAAGLGAGTVALVDEFMLKGLFPFFATFVHQLGFAVTSLETAGQPALKRGIQESNVPFCAPMQLYHGLISDLATQRADFLLLPMLRSLPRVDGEPSAAVCPIVQASADLLRWDLKPESARRVISPVIDLGQTNLQSPECLAACERLAVQLGVTGPGWREAWQQAQSAQQRFDEQCLDLGRRALSYCVKHGITPIVVVGRPYTIYNTVLNSNVPAILREQGTIPIPLDCYPVEAAVPVFNDMYWGHGQRILRAAHQIRRTPGVYSVYCSNYSCGPDSFTLHFYSYIMDGKPFAILETDGHAGDAGTKTRLEAFLHCVALDRPNAEGKRPPNDFRRVEAMPARAPRASPDHARILVPWMGPGSLTVAACLRSLGLWAEGLPQPDAQALSLGRRFTSGKECLPMCLTLGNLLKRLEAAKDCSEPFVLLMPKTQGPCRFGIYNLLNRITLERLKLEDRIRIWSPSEPDYFTDCPPGWAMLVFSGFMAADLLQQALLDVRPVETRPGTASLIYERYFAELLALLERQRALVESVPASLWQMATGRLFGVRSLLRRAAGDFAAVRRGADLPTVLLVGEVYVRCDPFANDFIIEKLETRGLRVRLAPFHEWLEYVDEINRRSRASRGLSERFVSWIQSWIQAQCYSDCADFLGWPKRTSVRQAMAAAAPFVRPQLTGEAILTLGEPLAEFRAGHIDAALSVGPLECMPNKIAEAQFFHVAEREGLPTLTLSLNGDAVDPEVIDNFAFEVHAHHRARARPRACLSRHPQNAR